MMKQSVIIGWQIALIHIVVIWDNCIVYTTQTKSSLDQYEYVVPANFLNTVNVTRHAIRSQKNNYISRVNSNYNREKLATNTNHNDHYHPLHDNESATSKRSKRNSNANDLCKTERCKCTSESNFLTVECHLSDDSTFVEHDVPQADTILIKLSSDAKFKLRMNSFNQNRLNRVLIEGSKWGREQVEIDTKAFNGMAGPFPEIEIANVHTVFIHPKAFYNEYKLNISNCAQLTVSTESFAETTFHGFFENIQDFNLMEGAFSRTSAKIAIQNSNLKKIQKLHATLREIRFIGCAIETIESNAFDVLKIDSIIFENCHIGAIQSKSFTEKLLSNHFSLSGCQIDHIEKDAICGSGIDEVNIVNNSITRVDGGAIVLHSINVQIQSNNFTLTELFWFSVYEWSNVSIDGNHFGIYKRMRIEDSKSSWRCVFENNFITTTVPDSLNFKSPVCRIRQISFDQLCSCNSTYFTQLAHVDISTQSYCRIDRTLSHCFNATLYNVRAHEEDICKETSRIDCVNDRINAKPNGYFIDWRRLFNKKERLFHIYIVCGGLLIILIIALAVVIARRSFKKEKNYSDGPARDMILMESLHPTSATLNRGIYRDVCDQTFSHTDLLIIEKTLNDMKQKYPPEYYDQVHNNTQKLINGYLSETDKVKTIGEIVQCVEECENAGCDFLAFTDILYNHLGSSNGDTTTMNEILYTEPIRLSNGINGGYDHIYAEPQLQQSLLKSEYTVPIDLNDNSGHVYTEPLTGAIDYVSTKRRPNNNKPLVQFDPSHLYAQPSKAPKRQEQAIAAAIPSTSAMNRTHILPKTSHLSDTFKNSTHASSQESNGSQSDDSCASGITLPL